MIDLTVLATELKRRTAWQRTPEPIADVQYHQLLLEAVRELYVMTGRTQQFDEALVAYEDDAPVSYDAELMIDEREFVLTTAEIGFFRLVQTNVNNIVGYTTDALSITNADKPYQYISTTLKELEAKRRIYYYKMTRYTLL